MYTTKTRNDTILKTLTEKGPIMNETCEAVKSGKYFEQTVLVNGGRASTQTDEQLYAALNAIDNEIERLNKHKTKPKKLEAKIANLEQQAKGLKEYIDDRP